MTIALAVPGIACAGGYAVVQESVRGAGAAYAGATSAAEDPSTVHSNRG